ncbi:bifunctional folylpolyglutamate synthase/dihydrofolate synthase [Konateibacter massiliensis]|uniref:bifunctional folylpolyglutamate synthase/dihydrofolate synthase n=1 Tax=Konateibacter massiliensis TaxID=2002841 RepID=UPI000C1525FB|nr:folylpolyglutamate synthase/dihydrofolate synthase family protein [Konateibacter massiliensis]
MYEKAREYLDGITKYGSVLGLDSIRELLSRLGNPQDDLKFVHVAGTNGKGSTVAFISTILKEAGCKVGRYTSPSVFSYREKIQVNEIYIERESLAKLVFQIKAVISNMTEEGQAHPTIFEVETALAFLYFKQENCDIVVLETGLGGLLDATNIVKNTLVSVLTSISRDHMDFLGGSIEEIAFQKAGIIKKNAIVVTAEQEAGAMQVIKEQCQKGDNQLVAAQTEELSQIRYENLSVFFDYKEFGQIEIGLVGSYQIKNAILSIEAVKALRKKGFAISNEAIRQGLKNAKWKGRFTLICEKPVVIIDGAHNEAAAEELKKTIENLFQDKRRLQAASPAMEKKLLFVMGVFADKEYERILQILAPLAHRILTVTILDNPRALDGEVLARTAEKYHTRVEFMPSLETAALECMRQTKEEEAVIAFGSLSYLAEFERQIKALVMN